MNESLLVQMSAEELRILLAETVKEVIERVAVKEKRYYSREEVAEKFKVSLPTVHSWVNSGRITALKIGGRTLFDADEVDNAAEEKRVLRYGHKQRW